MIDGPNCERMFVANQKDTELVRFTRIGIEDHFSGSFAPRTEIYPLKEWMGRLVGAP